MALLDRIRFQLRMLRIAWIAKPITGAEETAEKTEETKGSEETTKEEPAKKSEEAKTEEKVTAEDDWQTKSRKHERDAKRERKAREELETKLKQREDADKSEQEKAIEAARGEGEKKAREAAEKERRGDRLEVAVTRQAAKGVKTGEGEDAKTLRFADTEDALLRVQRGISRGDIDADDIYDAEGKVKTDALDVALAEILEANPHLAGGEGERPKPTGESDARKGDTAQKDLESMTPEDHAKRKYDKK